MTSAIGQDRSEQNNSYRNVYLEKGCLANGN